MGCGLVEPVWKPGKFIGGGVMRRDLPRRPCPTCRRLFQGLPHKVYCSLPCKRSHALQPSPHEPVASVDRILDDAVRLECAPPWVRHPQAWTNVAGRHP